MKKPKPRRPRKAAAGRKRKPDPSPTADPPPEPSPAAASDPSPDHVREVVALLCHGAEPDDILAHAAKEAWPYTAGQLLQAQTMAYAMMRAGLNETPENVRARHVRQRRLLFAKCMKLQDYKTAHAVLRDEGRLLGVYEPPPEADDSEGRALLDLVARMTEAELLRVTHEAAADPEPGRSGADGAAPPP